MERLAGRQWLYDHDRGRHVVGRAYAEPAYGGDRLLAGALLALPIGALYYLLILPATEQSLMLLCLSLGTLTFLCGMEVQKRRLGSLGTLASTLNILVLSNPMHFPLQSFLDNALGQVIGCALAWLVLLLVRDHSRVHTGRMVQRRLLCAALATLGAKGTRGNLLPALYRQLAMVLTLFPRGYRPLSSRLDADRVAPKPAPGGATL